MTIFVKMLELAVIAAWLPIVIGVIGRLMIFRKDEHQLGVGHVRLLQRSEYSYTAEEEFGIPDQEPKRSPGEEQEPMLLD